MSRLVTLGRLANGRFTRPIEDTATCSASSHRGGGLRWGPSAAVVALATAIGYVVGVVGSPDQTDAAALASPSPTPLASFVVVIPSDPPSRTPEPATIPPIPSSAPTPAPTPVPVSTQPSQTVIVVQLPPSGGGSGGSVVTRSVETTRVIREVVTATAPPAPSVTVICVDPGRHLGRVCRVTR